MLVHQPARYQKPCRILVGIFKVKIGGDEVILHHQNRVNDLARPRHPHLVSGLGLGAGHFHRTLAEDIENRLGLIGIADVGGCGVGIDIAYFRLGDSGTADSHLEGAARAVHIWG